MCAESSRAQLEVLSSEELQEKAAREAEPVLEVSPHVLRATVAKDETAAFRLAISNAGGRKLRWRLRSSLRGLRFSVGEGELGYRGSQVVSLSFAGRAVPGETVRGEVVVDAPGASGSPVRVPVSVRVKTPPAEEPAEPEEQEKPDEPRKLGPRARRFRRAKTIKAEEPKPPPGTPQTRPTSRKPFGVHVGYSAPAGGDVEAYLGGPVVGVHYRSGGEGAPLGFEFGLDFVSSDSSAGDATSSILMVEAAALFRPGAGRAFYVLGGGRLVAESVSVESPDSGGVAAAVDLGGGVTFAGGRMDLRATYSFLIGSRNVPGFGGVAVGYSF
jgi:hypothetical protein